MTTQDTTTHACSECQPGPDELRDRIAAEIASYWEGRPLKDVASIAGHLAQLAMGVLGPVVGVQQEVVMTLAAERIRLQQELAMARTEAKIWRARADGWQDTAAQYRADSQRHEDLATELSKQVDALVRQDDRRRAALGSGDTRQPDEWHLGDPEPSGWPMHVIGSRSSQIWTREQPAPGGYWLNESPEGIRGETWEDLLEAESAVTRHG